ncbi:MAG TPA: CHAD domain-containing protein [Microvirga sp.]|jgi:inorganic triphosphatase YgiF
MGSGRRTKKSRAAGAAPREIELKLEAEPLAIDRLLAHPLIKAAGAGRRARLHAIYYDTPDETLRRAGISLRTRREGRRWIQTIKADRDSGALALDRSEWETPVKGEALNLDAAAGTALEAHLHDGIGPLLRPAFTVTSERRTHVLEREGATVEVVLDRAEVQADGRSTAFGEVEIEIKHGSAAPLFGLALELAEAVPLRLSLTTKSARGYALGQTEPQKPVKAQPVTFVRGTTSAATFQAIARSCLAQAVRNEALLRSTRDPGALHQMRVGLRRLRAAISLFKDMMEDPQSEAIRGELRTVSHQLGALRDLDVFIGRLEEGDPALVEARERRERAYDGMLETLDTPRLCSLTLRVAAWIEAGDWLEADDADLRHARDQRIERRAQKQLGRRWKRVLKRMKHLADLEPEARHRVRIEIKKLRYGAEFFQSLFPGTKDSRKAILAGLESLQETLGELNDIAVGGGMLGEGAMPEEGGAAEAEAAEERTAALLAHAWADAKRLAEVEPFWE